MAKQKSRFPSYGLVRGPSHEHGGVAGMVADEQPVELEGGEWIIPKEAVPDYLPVLQQITEVGRERQRMQSGNSAIDALIASASLQTGLAQPKSPMFMGGGMMDKYEGGGQLHSRRMYNQKDKKKYGYEMGGMMPEYQDGGAVADKTRVSQTYYPTESLNLPMANLASPINVGSISQAPMSNEDMFQIVMDVAMPGSVIGSISRKNPFSMSAKASKIPNRRDASGRLYKDPIGGLSKKGMLKLVEDAVPENTMDAYGEGLDYFKNLNADDLADVVRSAYGLARNPRFYGEERIGEGAFDLGREGVKMALDDIKNLNIKKQGGPIDYYQAGGQALPRKQQELRNPEVYGPPVPVDMDSLLKVIRMRNVNESINPFTGDTIDTVLDSIRLKQQMDKSKMPRAGRKKMRQGGFVRYANGGQVGAGQPLRRIGPENMGEVTGMPQLGSISRPEFEAMMEYGGPPQASDSLMAAVGQDKRVKPVDIYSIFGGKGQTKAQLEIPKLSTAYLPSFGMETPLSKRQQAALFRKGIAPQTLNPQVKGLINRALVQRLTNEDD